MKLLKFLADPKKIVFSYQSENEVNTIETSDMPLSRVYDALAACADAAVFVFDAGPKLKHGLRIRGFSLAYTKEDSRSIQLHLARKLGETENEFQFKTPFARIDEPIESDSIILPTKHRELVEEAINACKAYALGERSQATLPFDEETFSEELMDDRVSVGE